MKWRSGIRGAPGLRQVMMAACASLMLVTSEGWAQQATFSTRSPDADPVIRQCLERDKSASAADRLNCWDTAKGLAPTDSIVLKGLMDAQRDVRLAEQANLTVAAQTKSARDSIEFLLAKANTDLVNGSVDGADTYVTRVLQLDPNNVEAQSLRVKVSAARKWQARKNLLMAVGAVVAAMSVVIFALVKRVAARREAAATAAAKPAASGGGGPSTKVALRIVDGIGRGRMYTITTDSFRIGAAESDKAEEQNDLVLNDSEGLISRFHCALLKRKKKWAIMDSSVNGTWVNDQRLERGELVSIRDGDEITIAGVTRLTFIA